MAQSRLEKIGTIFTRVTGLLRTGAMKADDRPMWYDLYEAFPPKLDPRFDRPVPNAPVRNIFYEEDFTRAKFHKSLKQQEVVSLLDRKKETQTQQFLKIYQDLKSQGALDEDKIFETSVELLQEQRAQIKAEGQENVIEPMDNEIKSKVNLAHAFTEAKEATASESISINKKSSSKSTAGGINIENLFKE